MKTTGNDESNIVAEIQRLALQSPGEHFFYGPIEEAIVREAEDSLGVKFPPSYRVYLKRFGAAKMLNYDFDGLPDNSTYLDEPPFFIHAVEHTLMFRDEVDYFSSKMIYVTDDGGPIFYCLDTAIVTQDGESPVVAYFLGKRIIVAPSFIEFLHLLADVPRLHAIINSQ